MRAIREVGEKGQIVIPKDVREQLGIKSGSKLVIDIDDGEIRMHPAMSADEFVKYFCSTSKKLKKPLSIKDIKKTLEEQYELH